jgi:hypothetical protein
MMTFEIQVWNASRKLLPHALRLTRNNTDRAEDLLSEAVMSALTSKTRPDHKVQPWLYGVLRNRFIDEKRRSRGRNCAQEPRLIFMDTLPDTEQDLCTPEAILLAKQGLQRALAAQKVSPPKVHKNAKLTAADVIYIRSTGRNTPTKELMVKFGVGFDTINRIKKGQSYKGGAAS